MSTEHGKALMIALSERACIPAGAWLCVHALCISFGEYTSVVVRICTLLHVRACVRVCGGTRVCLCVHVCGCMSDESHTSFHNTSAAEWEDGTHGETAML